MKQVAIAATAMLALAGPALLSAAPAGAQDLGSETARPAPTDSAAPKRAHPPAHIRVRPLLPSYPGPEAVRQCAFWLATEYRPSGTVIVPRQRCWWERGS